MGIVQRKGYAILYHIIGALASVVNTCIALIHLVWEILKDKKQKSNRSEPKD